MTSHPFDGPDKVHEALYDELVVWATFELGSRQAAEDAVQSAFAELVRKWHGVDNPVRYVRSIVRNRIVSERRRRKHVLAYVTSRRNEEESMPLSDTTAIRDVVRRLPRREREVVELRLLLDLPESEVAELLECPTGTVSSRLSRGLAILRREWKR